MDCSTFPKFQTMIDKKQEELKILRTYIITILQSKLSLDMINYCINVFL